MASDETYLFERCPAGARVTAGGDSLIVDPETMRFLPRGAGSPKEIPSGGRWMRVSFRPRKAALGMANLADCTLEELGRRVFRLGIYGTLTFEPAHIAGLKPLLLSRDAATPDEVLFLLQPELKPAVSKAVCGALEGVRDYRKIRDEMLPRLARAISPALFEALFENGLCMHCGSFRIENISRPVIKRPA